MSTEPIQHFVEQLNAEFARDMRGPNVLALLEDYVANHDDWRRFAMFREDGTRYSRNLVERNDAYELLVLCWGPGQTSPIHNHEGQNCWMAILEGAIEEVYYRFPDGSGSPLAQVGEPTTYRAGQAGYISDEIALHLIRPSGDARAVSLHLYSRPFDKCNLYCPDTSEVTLCRLGYHSRHGELVPA